MRHTGKGVPIVVFDDAGPSEVAIRELLEAEAEEGREVFYLRHPENLGVVDNLNSAFDLLNPADVIVLNSDVIVGPGWSDGVIAAARSRTDIATATAFCSDGTIFTVRPPDRWLVETPTVDEFADVARVIKERTAPIYPIAPVATSFCTFFARKALNVVGKLDPEYSPGYGEEVDFSFRCSAHGFTHVAVDDVYVYHATGESFGEVHIENTRKIDNDLLTLRRYADWHRMTHEDFEVGETPLTMAKRRAGVLFHGLTIAVAAEKIHPIYTGTYEVAAGLSRALAQSGRVASVIWVATEERVAELRQLADEVCPGVTVLTLREIKDQALDIDVAFLPHQDHDGQLWPELAEHAHRNIVWQLDLIATLNPQYQSSYDDYDHLKRCVERSLVNADAVGVLTHHVAQTLRGRFLARTHKEVFVLPCGALQQAPSAPEDLTPARPDLEALRDERYLLVLGTNFLHKNWVWLMRLALRVRSLGWSGKFVFAGPTPVGGGDSKQLQDDLIRLTESEDVFIFLGHVSDEEKNWLLDRATLVVSPTITEGWGIIPTEAAAHGTAAIATRGGGLRDITPADADVLTLEDDALDAAILFDVAANDSRRAAQLRKWTVAAERFRWEDSAAILLDACEVVLLQARAIRPPTVVHEVTREVETVTVHEVEPYPGIRELIRRASFRWLPPGSQKRRVVKALLGWAVRR